MELNPTPDNKPKSFKMSHLRYKGGKEWKLPAYDVCYYELRNSPHIFKNGNTFLKFTNIEKGVSVYVNSGSDVRNMSTSVSGTSKKNDTVKVDTQYQVPMGETFIITAIPTENSYNTTFEFEYYSDGEALPGLIRFYNALFVVPENGQTFLIAAIVLIGLLLICIICGCVMCIKKRLHSASMPKKG